VERHRTAGMTAIAVLNIVFGALGILAGLFNLLGVMALMNEMVRLHVFEVPIARLSFSLLLLATGIIGMIAGVGMFAPRPWARKLSLAYAGLLIASAVFSYLTIPLIGTIGTYDIRSITGFNLARLIIFGVIYVAMPVPYSIVLCVVFCTSTWRAAFAKIAAPQSAG
jgi:hypothetical protein